MRIEGGGPQGRFVGVFQDECREGPPSGAGDARVGHGERLTEDLRHEETWRDAAGDFHVPVQPHAKSVTEQILFGDAQRSERPRDRCETRLGAQGVAIAHGPQRVVLITECCAEVSQAVDLPILRLTHMAVNGCEVVSIDRRGPSSDRARRSLGPIESVSSHTVFRRDIRPCHLQQIELRGYLEQRVPVDLIAIESPDVTHDFRDPKGPVQRALDAGGPVSSSASHGVSSTPTAYEWLFDPGTQRVAHDLEVRPSLLVAEFLELHQVVHQSPTSGHNRLGKHVLERRPRTRNRYGLRGCWTAGLRPTTGAPAADLGGSRPAPPGAPATPATDCRSARAGARSDGARGAWRTGGRAGTIAGAPCATAPARRCERSARTGCSRRTACLRRTGTPAPASHKRRPRPFSRSTSGIDDAIPQRAGARTGLERGMVERDERPLAWPACHLRLSLCADRLVPNHAGHAADDGRIWIVPPGSWSPAAAQNLGVLRATRPVDHPVPDGCPIVCRCRRTYTWSSCQNRMVVRTSSPPSRPLTNGTDGPSTGSR